MATVFATPVLPFTDPFAALETQIEASTRALSASAEFYAQVLNTQAAATRAFFGAYSGLGAQIASQTERTSQTIERAAETTERAAETTERTAEAAARASRTAAREPSRATKRATRRPASTTRRAAQPAAAAAAAPVAPISGYDKLTTEEIVAKLPEQQQNALVVIAAYERAKENRATVLQRIAALTGPEPVPGYDTLAADAAQELVTNGSPALAATVRDYERRHKDRADVVEAAARHAEADAS
jgi:hypothetical protein